MHLDDTIVYLKLIVSPLEEHKIMSIMFYLNMWKLAGDKSRFNTHDFFDRGMRLLLQKKFGIYVYTYFSHADSYNKRTRDNRDFDMLDKYFCDEKEWVGYFKYGYGDVKKLMSNKRIVDDLRQIVKENSFREKPFPHYDTFLEGFIMFLSRRRVEGNEEDIKFETYLEYLKADKFFKKLQKMSWTDSTRKAVFRFYHQFEMVKEK